MTDPSPAELLRQAKAASAAVDVARENMRKEKTAVAAIEFCKAFQAAKAAREALPKLRAIA